MNYLLVGQSQSDLPIGNFASDADRGNSVGFDMLFGGSGKEARVAIDSGSFVALVFEFVGPH